MFLLLVKEKKKKKKKKSFSLNPTSFPQRSLGRSLFIKFHSRHPPPPFISFIFRLFFSLPKFLAYIFQVQCHGNVVIGLFAWLVSREKKPTYRRIVHGPSFEWGIINFSLFQVLLFLFFFSFFNWRKGKVSSLNWSLTHRSSPSSTSIVS